MFSASESAWFSSGILRCEGLIPRNWIFSLRKSHTLCPAKTLQLPTKTWCKTSDLGTFGCVPKLISWDAHTCADCPGTMTCRNCGCAVTNPAQESTAWGGFVFRGSPLCHSLVPKLGGTQHNWGDSNSSVPFNTSTVPQLESHPAFCQLPNCKINTHLLLTINYFQLLSHPMIGISSPPSACLRLIGALDLLEICFKGM